MAVSGGSPIPYRRLTDPLILPVATTSTRFQVPAGFIPPEATTFRVSNPNAFAVRLKGSNAPDASSLSIGPNEGWRFPPGFEGSFTTQFPTYMATVAVGAGAGSGSIEITYGIGGGSESVANLGAVQSVSDAGGSLTVDTGTSGTFAPTPTGGAAFAITPLVAAGVTSLVAKASAGNLYSASVVTTSGGPAFYLIALNRTTVPASGAAITQSEMLGCQYIFAGSYGSLNPDDIPDRFSTGIVLICSTSTTTYNPAMAANILHLKARVV